MHCMFGPFIDNAFSSVKNTLAKHKILVVQIIGAKTWFVCKTNHDVVF